MIRLPLSRLDLDGSLLAWPSAACRINRLSPSHEPLASWLVDSGVIDADRIGRWTDS